MVYGGKCLHNTTYIVLSTTGCKDIHINPECRLMTLVTVKKYNIPLLLLQNIFLLIQNSVEIIYFYTT